MVDSNGSHSVVDNEASTSCGSSRKSVSFDMSKNTQREMVHVNDLTKEEKELLWITTCEFMETKKEYTKVVKMMMRSCEPLQETDEICCRGLEFRTKEGSRKRKRAKKMAVDAVLIEQELQHDEGIFDDNWICEVYREVSGPSALEALNRGLKDQKVMLELLDPATQLERDQKALMDSNHNKKGDVLSKPRRRSISETVNGNDMQSTLRLVSELK